MIAPADPCVCAMCETVREHGWRAEPRKTFAVGVLVGFGGAMLGVVLALLLIGLGI